MSSLFWQKVEKNNRDFVQISVLLPLYMLVIIPINFTLQGGGGCNMNYSLVMTLTWRFLLVFYFYRSMRFPKD